MSRRLFFSLLSVLSLLLCTVSALLWLASAFIRDTAANPAPRLWLMRPGEGDWYLILTRGHVTEWMYTPWDGNWYLSDRHPLWVPTLTFLVIALAARTLSRLKLVNATRFGRCANCGYDLRATPDRCPECGTPNLVPPKKPGIST